jgi:hypothetical protein
MSLSNRQRYVPALCIPFMYLWIATEPARVWLSCLLAGRKHQQAKQDRAKSALELADELEDQIAVLGRSASQSDMPSTKSER